MLKSVIRGALPMLAAAATVLAVSLTPAMAKELRVLAWQGYADDDWVKAFEKEYGIKVKYDTYDGDETLEAKLLAGHTGYDVVFPSSNYVARGVRALGISLQALLDAGIDPYLKVRALGVVVAWPLIALLVHAAATALRRRHG